MKNRKRFIILMLILTTAVSCTACKTNTISQSENSTQENTEIKEQNISEESTEDSSENEIESLTDVSTATTESETETFIDVTEEQPQIVELSNTYTTKFAETNVITYPDFMFDYPNNWTISTEEVTSDGEIVILSNERNVTITFSHIGGVLEGQLGSGSSTDMLRVDISKVADSSFTPGYVQDNDHSNLGKFIVAKLEVTGHLDMLLGSDFEDIDGGVSYAVLPESWIGTRDDIQGAFEGEFAFWYSNYISLIADAPDRQFTEEEEKEVIEILSSFRVEN